MINISTPLPQVEEKKTHSQGHVSEQIISPQSFINKNDNPNPPQNNGEHKVNPNTTVNLSMNISRTESIQPTSSQKPNSSDPNLAHPPTQIIQQPRLFHNPGQTMSSLSSTGTNPPFLEFLKHPSLGKDYLIQENNLIAFYRFLSLENDINLTPNESSDFSQTDFLSNLINCKSTIDNFQEKILNLSQESSKIFSELRNVFEAIKQNDPKKFLPNIFKDKKEPSSVRVPDRERPRNLKKLKEKIPLEIYSNIFNRSIHPNQIFELENLNQNFVMNKTCIFCQKEFENLLVLNPCGHQLICEGCSKSEEFQKTNECPICLTRFAEKKAVQLFDVNNECIICSSNISNTIFYPCGHTTCFECAQNSNGKCLHCGSAHQSFKYLHKITPDILQERF